MLNLLTSIFRYSIRMMNCVTEKVKILPRFFVNVLSIINDENCWLRLIVEDFIRWIRRICHKFMDKFFEHFAFRISIEFIDIDVKFIEIRS